MKHFFFNICFYALILSAGCMSSSWNSIGERQLSRGEYSKAIHAFSFAIEKEENLARSYFLRGYAHLKMKRNAKAILDLQESLKMQEAFLTSWTLGYAYFADDNITLADICFSDLCKKYPKDPWAYWGYGICCLYRAEDFRGALHSFSTALSLEDSNVNFMAAYSRALFCLGEYEKCIDFLDEKIKTAPDCLTLKVELMAALIYSGRPVDQNLMQITKMELEKLPDSSSIKYQLLARLDAKNGNFKQAVEDLQKAVAANRNSRDLLSCVYAQALSNILEAYRENRLFPAAQEQAQRMFYLYAPQMLNISAR